MIATPSGRIEHEETGGRGAFFVMHAGRRVAELTYSTSGADVIVGHTWVDPALRGGQFGADLVNAVADWARGKDRKIVPVCSYVRAVFDRSPQYADVWKR